MKVKKSKTQTKLYYITCTRLQGWITKQTLKQDLGLRVLDAQVVSPLSAEFLASKYKGKYHTLKDL